MFGRHGFFRAHWGEGAFQKGDIKYVILSLLKEKPRHGYEIIRALEERSHGYYSPSPGAIYPMLQMLEDAGYATSMQQDSKRVYSITDSGLAFLAEREKQGNVFEAGCGWGWDPVAGAELGKTWHELGKFRHLFHGRWRSISPEKSRRIREVISLAYKDIEAIMDEDASVQSGK